MNVQSVETTTKLLPKEFQPGPKDVLIGRGKKCYQHIGNKNFLAIVASKLDVYSAASTKQDKSNILAEVVQEIRKLSPNGGFLKQDGKTGQWFEVGDFLAREKTSQAFRDSLHDKYRSSNSFKKQRRQRESAKNKGQQSAQEPVPSPEQQLSAAALPEDNLPPQLSEELERDTSEHILDVLNDEDFSPDNFFEDPSDSFTDFCSNIVAGGADIPQSSAGADVSHSSLPDIDFEDGDICSDTNPVFDQTFSFEDVMTDVNSMEDNVTSDPSPISSANFAAPAPAPIVVTPQQQPQPVFSVNVETLQSLEHMSLEPDPIASTSLPTKTSNAFQENVIRMGTPSLPNPIDRRRMMLQKTASDRRMRLQKASSDRNLQYMMDKRRTMLQRSSSDRKIKRTPSDRKLQKTPSDRKLGSIGKVSSIPKLAKHKSNSMRNLMKSSTLGEIIQIPASEQQNATFQPKQNMLSSSPDMLDKRQMLGRLQRPSSLRNLMKNGQVGVARSSSSGNLKTAMMKQKQVEPGFENVNKSGGGGGGFQSLRTARALQNAAPGLFDVSPLDMHMQFQNHGMQCS